jgi:hypothetical protein
VRCQKDTELPDGPKNLLHGYPHRDLEFGRSPDFSFGKARPGQASGRSFAVSPARRIQSMSFMVWHVMRRLPRPALLCLMIFLLTPVARA